MAKQNNKAWFYHILRSRPSQSCPLISQRLCRKQNNRQRIAWPVIITGYVFETSIKQRAVVLLFCSVTKLQKSICIELFEFKQLNSQVKLQSSIQYVIITNKISSWMLMTRNWCFFLAVFQIFLLLQKFPWAPIWPRVHDVTAHAFNSTCLHRRRFIPPKRVHSRYM